MDPLWQFIKGGLKCPKDEFNIIQDHMAILINTNREKMEAIMKRDMSRWKLSSTQSKRGWRWR
jgi:hypothetical protein